MKNGFLLVMNVSQEEVVSPEVLQVHLKDLELEKASIELLDLLGPLLPRYRAR